VFPTMMMKRMSSGTVLRGITPKKKSFVRACFSCYEKLITKSSF
jgi:hypothetical protein